MFTDNPWKSFLYGLLMVLLLLALLGLNVLEFLHYFIARGENTLFEQPVEVAARAEFFIMLLFSVPAVLINLYLLSRIRRPSVSHYAICLFFILIQAIKLFFYLPNVTLSEAPLWYLLKQFPPVLLSAFVGVMSFLKLSDLKFEKYQ